MFAGASGLVDVSIDERLLPLTAFLARGTTIADRKFPLLTSLLRHASWLPKCSLVDNSVTCTADLTTAAVAALLLAWGALALACAPINALRRLKAKGRAQEEGIAENTTPETSPSARSDLASSRLVGRFNLAAAGCR